MTSKRALRARVEELERQLRDAQSDLEWYRKPDPEPAKDASLAEAERIVRHIADNWTGPSGAYRTLLEAYDQRTTALTEIAAAGDGSTIYLLRSNARAALSAGQEDKA